ncbi:helicase-related protein [Meiothermus sp. CFH 77666]|uniref:helicase-related protein n=1 Tax=Meiothermus sp. CFH 77666 TaxID=2817942 RepID=UPI001FB175C7|nr:helicase-related protein [Meiothermus sp. CFH 77666]
MPRATLSSSLKDNHSRGSVGDFLREKIRPGSEMAVVSAFFTIYAYEALRAQLDSISSMRFLFGEPNFVRTLDPSKQHAPNVRIEQDTLELEQQLKQSRVARLCADWIKDKVEVRSIKKPGFVHGKVYQIKHGDYQEAILGSSNFTVQGLGLGKRNNIELNIEVTDRRDRDDLRDWFEELWNNPELVEDVKRQVLEHLERLYTPTSPQFVYYKTLYHLFGQQKAELGTELKQRQRLNESEIWKTLFEFQRHGAEAAIRKLLTHGGCILADSVGLGKTYTALAVIKYFENLNDRVLVLTPKKLRENWTVYQAQNNSPLNRFLKDRFAYTVLSHTDLSRESGLVGDINLQTLNWGNYDLVVIDESHNFRNNNRGRRGPDGQVIRKSRYERLLEDIINSGVPTKVLLLSATPVNTDLSDLRNQLLLISGGKDGAFAETLGVSSLKDVLAVAQREFNQWAELKQRNPEELLERLSAAFFSLLDGLTLARSRRHIQTYYAHEMARLGGFPERQKPEAIYAKIDTENIFPEYNDVHDDIDKYQLALFNPFNYVLEDFRPQYDRDGVANFTQANRERYLIGMMKVNFLKRLESSVHSFALTLERTCTKISELIGKLEAFKARQQNGELESVQLEAEDDEELQEALQVGKQIKYDLRHLDVERWLKDLQADFEQLNDLLGVARMVTPERDAKLAKLRGLLEAKIQNPTRNKLGQPNRKTLVFTAFADTAQYLYRQLEPWARAQGVHIGLVVGSGDNRATLGPNDFNAILTNFAPRAKQRERLSDFPKDQEIDILIATDCISEGQNLQDCDYLVNYDIHWNPVRIIQRFGRIDRIGSPNQRIQMVNFWPTDDLNAYLNLKNRVEARMALVDLTATAQDNPLTPDQIRTDLSYRDQQLLRLRDEVLDLEDLEGGVTLADFSLDDFRMDLSNFLDAHREALEQAPLGLFGLVNQEGAAKPGIIFCLRQTGPAVEAGLNPLTPYFLVYVRSDGSVRYTYAQAKQTLELYRALCADKHRADQTLHDYFDKLTNNLENLEHQTSLLRAALDSIRSTFQRKTAQELFSGRGATVPKLEAQVTEDTPFELITWLVILDNHNQMV